MEQDKRNRLKSDYTFKDLYKFYKKRYDNPLDRITYMRFLTEFYTEILNLVLYNGIDYNLPARLGSLRIRKRQNVQKINDDGELIHNLKPDWKKSKELWAKKYPDKTPKELKLIPHKPIVYHMNEHTDGYYFEWHWDKLTCNVKNQTAYRFEPIRNKKREASKAWQTIPKLRNIYYE